MFGKRYKLFKLMGFEVGVDLSWIILAILIAWSLSTGFFPFQVSHLSPRMYWMMGITGALGLFLSIIIHEFSHSVVARRSGMDIKGITLFIFGGVAQMGDEPARPKDEFFMAVAGPVASLILGAVFYGFFRLGAAAGWTPAFNAVMSYLSFINVLLAIFNLIPALPLDGGRILRSFLWQVKKDLRWATRIASAIGSGFGIFLILLGVLRVLSGNFIGGMWFFLIGMFLQSAARMSYQQLIVRKTLEGEPLRRFISTDPVTVSPDTSLQALVDDYFLRFHYKMYPVVSQTDGQRNLVGCVDLKQVKKIDREEWPRRKVSDLIQTCSVENTISPDVDAMDALAKLRNNHVSRLMVTEKDQLVGVVALKDMLEFLSMKMELDPGSGR